MGKRTIEAQGTRNLPAFISFILLIAVCLLFIARGASAQNTPPVSPAASQSQVGAQVGPGQSVQVEGELEILYQDFKDHSRLSYSLKRSDGTHVPLQFTKEPPTHLLTGHHVRVSGQLSDGGLILYSGSTSVTSATTSSDATGTSTTSIPVPNTFGVQSALVILVNFQDSPTQPFTTGDAYNAVFGTANNFIIENSYGQTSLTGSVVGWYTVPESITTCNMSQIAADAQTAASAAGTNLALYTRYLYVFPSNSACGWAGSSYVGGNPSQSWINGSLDSHTVDHELGHAFGLWHSHSLDCGMGATICSSGTVVEYGDVLDAMGQPQKPSPHYNTFQKERLGWLNYAAPTIQTVTAIGTYTINTYELGGAGPNALKILKSTDPTTGAKTWYYLEQRQSVGFDSFFTDGTCFTCGTQNETNGVLFHIGTDGNGNSDEMLDMTPATPTSSGYYDQSLVVGQSFQDAAANLTITPTAVNSASAALQITFGGSVCSAANPTVTVTPSQSQSVASGTAVNFTATVTDNDSSSCAPTAFSLASALPSGWTGTWSASALSLSPGKSGSATLTVTSSAGTADGSYNVAVSATNSSAASYSASAVATYVTNTAPLSIGLTTNQSSYLPGQTVAITATVLYGTTPDAGASVTATITAPNGKTTSLSGTTGSNGVALLNYKLSNSAAAGTYPVQAQAGTTRSGGGRTKGGASTASTTVGASTIFTVQ
jgi:M6 family metalloprotease-like protein